MDSRVTTAIGSLLGLAIAAALLWWVFDLPLAKAVAGCVAAVMVIAIGIRGARQK